MLNEKEYKPKQEIKLPINAGIAIVLHRATAAGFFIFVRRVISK